MTRHATLVGNARRCAPTVALVVALAASGGCARGLKEVLGQHGYAYPFHASRRVADARQLKHGGECERAQDAVPLLKRGLAMITDAELEQIAWRRCPAGSAAALFHGAFVYVAAGQPAFAMTLSCFGTEEPTPGFDEAMQRAQADDIISEPTRLLDGWVASPSLGDPDYWEIRNIALFRWRGSTFEYEDMLGHYSESEALARIQPTPGERSELIAALSCSTRAEWGPSTR